MPDGVANHVLDGPPQAARSPTAPQLPCAFSCTKCGCTPGRLWLPPLAEAAKNAGCIMTDVMRLIKAICRFLDRHDGSITAVATLAIVVLTYFYVGYSKKQWETTLESNRITQATLVSAQRAYLAVGDIEEIANVIKIHMDNFGRAPATITGGYLEYMRVINYVMTDKRTIPVPVPRKAFPIMPSKASEFAVMMTIPHLNPVDQGGIIVVNGEIRFNTGFGAIDTLYVHLRYDTDTGKWVHVTEGVNVEFDKAPNTAKQK